MMTMRGCEFQYDGPLDRSSVRAIMANRLDSDEMYAVYPEKDNQVYEIIARQLIETLERLEIKRGCVAGPMGEIKNDIKE